MSQRTGTSASPPLSLRKADPEQRSSVQPHALLGFKQSSLCEINSEDKLQGLKALVGGGEPALSPLCITLHRA